MPGDVKDRFAIGLLGSFQIAIWLLVAIKSADSGIRAALYVQSRHTMAKTFLNEIVGRTTVI